MTTRRPTRLTTRRATHLATRRWQDAAIAAAVLALGEVETLTHAQYANGSVFRGPVLVNALLVVPAMAAPLAVRRRWPFPATLTVLAVLAVDALALGATEATAGFLALMIAVYSGAVYAGRPVAVALAAFVSITAHDLRDDQINGVGDVVFAYGLAAVAFALGLAVHARQARIGALETAAVGAGERYAAELAAATDAATAAERAAIARELHDIVAHTVSVIVIQAQAGRRALPGRPDVAEDVLDVIETSGRNALAELRRLLTVLAGEPTATPSPAPSLHQLPELVDRFAATGLSVHLDVADDLPELAAVADLASYRVVQEALTNTLRHAPGADATVSIRRDGPVLHISVQDTGARRSESVVPAGNGRGLVGMRERLALVGGELVEAGPSGRGFRVVAAIPLDGAGNVDLAPASHPRHAR